MEVMTVVIGWLNSGKDRGSNTFVFYVAPKKKRRRKKESPRSFLTTLADICTTQCQCVRSDDSERACGRRK
jgi:hypothetical protein